MLIFYSVIIVLSYIITSVYMIGGRRGGGGGGGGGIQMNPMPIGAASAGSLTRRRGDGVLRRSFSRR